MSWWKKLIYPFAYVAVMVLVLIFHFLSWVVSRGNRIPLRWEIVGIQKKKIFIKEI